MQLESKRRVVIGGVRLAATLEAALAEAALAEAALAEVRRQPHPPPRARARALALPVPSRPAWPRSLRSAHSPLLPPVPSPTARPSPVSLTPPGGTALWVAVQLIDAAAAGRRRDRRRIRGCLGCRRRGLRASSSSRLG